MADDIAKHFIEQDIKFYKDQLADMRKTWLDIKNIKALSKTPEAYDELLGTIQESAEYYKGRIRGILNGQS